MNPIAKIRADIVVPHWGEGRCSEAISTRRMLDVVASSNWIAGEKMDLVVDRDSVCAGDDVDTHEELRRYQPQMKIGAVVYSIVASGFVPEMSRGEAFWQVYADGTHVADIPGDGSQIHLRVDPDTELHALCDPHHRSRLEFKYRTGTATTTPSDGGSTWLIPGPRTYGT